MDPVREFLNEVRQQGYAAGNFLGLLNVLIGRRLARPDNTVISNGVTWRTLAGLLRRVRWDPEAVRELGVDPASLPPRDRERYWYSAIAQANVGSPAATQAGDQCAERLQSAGFHVGPAPKS
jgi:hypothetical protein